MKVTLVFALSFVIASVLASPLSGPKQGQKITDRIGHLRDKIEKREVNLREYYEESTREHILQKRGTPFGAILKGARVVRNGINKIHEKLGTGKEYKGKREVNLEEFYEKPSEQHILQKRGTPFGPIIAGSKIIRDAINKIHEKLGTGKEYKGKREVNLEELYEKPSEQHILQKRGTPFGPIIAGSKIIRDAINKIHEKLGTGREYKSKREVHPEEISALELKMMEQHEINKREASVKDKAKEAGWFLACRTPYYLANPGKCRKYDLF